MDSHPLTVESFGVPQGKERFNVVMVRRTFRDFAEMRQFTETAVRHPAFDSGTPHVFLFSENPFPQNYAPTRGESKQLLESLSRVLHEHHPRSLIAFSTNELLKTRVKQFDRPGGTFKPISGDALHVAGYLVGAEGYKGYSKVVLADGDEDKALWLLRSKFEASGVPVKLTLDDRAFLDRYWRRWTRWRRRADIKLDTNVMQLAAVTSAGPAKLAQIAATIQRVEREGTPDERADLERLSPVAVTYAKEQAKRSDVREQTALLSRQTLAPGKKLPSLRTWFPIGTYTSPFPRAVLTPKTGEPINVELRVCADATRPVPHTTPEPTVVVVPGNGLPLQKARSITDAFINDIDPRENRGRGATFYPADKTGSHVFNTNKPSGDRLQLIDWQAHLKRLGARVHLIH